MKSFPRPPSLRWSCRLIRWSALVAGERVAESRHVAHCAACRAHFAAQEALTERLRDGARRRNPPVPADLAARIADAVVAELPTARARPPQAVVRAPGLSWSLAGAAVAAAVALAVVWFRPGPKPALVTDNPSPGATAPLALSPSETPGGIWRIVGNRASTWTEDNELRREIDSVYSDTQAALRFLALNFLPATTTSRDDDNSRPASRS